jgi:hypothetical protein
LLLDACFHLIGAALPSSTDETDDSNIYLPVGLKYLQADKPAGEQIWCHVVVNLDGDQPVNSRQSHTANIYLYNERGERVAEISGLLLMRASRDVLRKAAGNQIEDSLYEVIWEKKPIETGEVISGDWLIFADHHNVGEGLAALLRERGIGYQFVLPSENYAANENDYYQINPTRPEDFRRLLQEITNSNISTVVYLWPLDVATDDIEGGKSFGCGAALNTGVGSQYTSPKATSVAGNRQRSSC